MFFMGARHETSIALTSPLSSGPRKPTVINVIIADHQPVFRAGVAKLLAAEDDMRVIAPSSFHQSFINAIEKLRPHVVILSSGFLPDPSDIATITEPWPASTTFPS